MQTQNKYEKNKYEKCVVVKQNSNNQAVAKVYFYHNPNSGIDNLLTLRINPVVI